MFDSQSSEENIKCKKSRIKLSYIHDQNLHKYQDSKYQNGAPYNLPIIWSNLRGVYCGYNTATQVLEPSYNSSCIMHRYQCDSHYDMVLSLLSHSSFHPYQVVYNIIHTSVTTSHSLGFGLGDISRPCPHPLWAIFSSFYIRATTPYSQGFCPRYISLPCPLVLFIGVWDRRHLLLLPLSTFCWGLGLKISSPLAPSYHLQGFRPRYISYSFPSVLFIGVWARRHLFPSPHHSTTIQGSPSSIFLFLQY